MVSARRRPISDQGAAREPSLASTPIGSSPNSIARSTGLRPRRSTSAASSSVDAALRRGIEPEADEVQHHAVERGIERVDIRAGDEAVAPRAARLRRSRGSGVYGTAFEIARVPARIGLGRIGMAEPGSDMPAAGILARRARSRGGRRIERLDADAVSAAADQPLVEIRTLLVDLVDGCAPRSVGRRRRRRDRVGSDWSAEFMRTEAPFRTMCSRGALIASGW